MTVHLLHEIKLNVNLMKLGNFIYVFLARTLLMAYSKAKLKSIGDRASPCFKPFLIGNLSDTFLPTRTLLYVSVRQDKVRSLGALQTNNAISEIRERWIEGYSHFSLQRFKCGKFNFSVLNENT